MSQVPIEEVLMGMATQLSEREDALLCSDVRDNLFGPMEFSRRDLGALNIMRGRDNGLPDYNTVRWENFEAVVIFTKQQQTPCDEMEGLILKMVWFYIYREYFGLSKIKTFNEINTDLFENNPDLLQKLIQIYDGKLDNIDVYIGNYLNLYLILK